VKMTRIDQLLAGFADGDAISNEAVHIRDILRKSGYESDIYADRTYTSPSMLHECVDVKAYKPGDMCIHHYSIGSPVVEIFSSANTRKVLIYHNITPADYFRVYDARVAEQLDSARRNLAKISSMADVVWADSEFNAGEIRSLGIKNVEVFPLLFSSNGLDIPDDPEVVTRLSGPLKTFLTVGRIAPNKRIEVLIKAFHYYVRKINPFSRLVIVGSARSCPRYYDLLQMMVSDLDVLNVCFDGFAAPKSLPAYYRNSDLFISVSDHEGYCLPLIEAMYHGTMVLAHRVGGMPEAMGGAGVLYQNLNPAHLAVLMDIMTSRPEIMREVLSSQSARIDSVKNRDVTGELMKLLSSAVGKR